MRSALYSMTPRSGTLLIALLLLALYFLTRTHLPHEVRPPTIPQLHISQTAFVAAPPTFTVHQGDIFHLIIESETAGSIHVHGYEHTAVLDQRAPVEVQFVADRANVFPIHLHQPVDPSQPNEALSHRHVATLHVMPK